MRGALGYVLQVAGLVIVGLALAVGIVRDAIATEVALLCIGAACFLAGRALGGREG